MKRSIFEVVTGVERTIARPRSFGGGAPGARLEIVESATLEWDGFDTRRLLEPIGSVPPAEYEARYYEEQAKVAYSHNSVPDEPVRFTVNTTGV